ncbi:hypothetical protein L6Q79_16080 [bacterium]|nr:hypothetical protein [bacterium]
MNLTPEINALYAIFEKYPLKYIEGGNSRSEEMLANQLLQSKELRSLSVDDLSFFVGHSITTFGGIDDWKHFCPRIIENLVIAQDDFHEKAVVLNRLRLGNWEQWPHDERNALDSFFKSNWIHQNLQLPNDDGEIIDSWLVAYSKIYDSLDWYLKKWVELEQIASQINLAIWVNRNAQRILEKNKMKDLFWDKEIGKSVIDFIKSEVVRKRIKKLSNVDTKYSECVYTACVYVDALQG